MEPLYERLLQQAFVSDKEAIEYCGKVCLDYGFNIKHETGANRVRRFILNYFLIIVYSSYLY